jgi:hypothetical protein
VGGSSHGGKSVSLTSRQYTWYTWSPTPVIPLCTDCGVVRLVVGLGIVRSSCFDEGRNARDEAEKVLADAIFRWETG